MSANIAIFRPMLQVYGSGDAGTKELIQMMLDRGIRYELCDIRQLDIHGRRRNLAFLMSGNSTGRTLTSVPQVFEENGTYRGDFQRVATWLNSVPELEFDIDPPVCA